MKKIVATLAFALFATAAFPQASVQIIHNCPTPAADSVDIYLYDGSNWGSSPAVSNLKFRHQTGYISLPSGIATLRVAIAPKDATPNLGDTLASFSVPNLMMGGAYVVMARGELGSSTAPFGLSFGAGRTTGTNPNQVDLTIFHGSTDAPSVGIFLSPNGTVAAVPSLAYNNFTGYVSLADADVNILLTLASNINTNVAGFNAPLNSAGLAGGAGVVYASGKLNPGPGEPAFGLYLALPSAGSSIALATQNLSRLQLAHNCPDPLAATVDVYLVNATDTLKVEDVPYRNATNFQLLPSGNYTVHFAPSSSGDISASIYNQNFTMAANTNYIAVANGLINTTAPSFADAVSVNGAAVNFNVSLFTNARIKSDIGGQVDLLALHQSPDAPTVDVFVQELGATLIDDFSYGDAEGYTPIAVPSNVNIDIRDGSGTTTVATFFAPLTALAGEAPTIFASGFLTPANENVAGLSSFGLFYITSAGGPFQPLSNVTSVEDETLVSVSVYPNPATDFIYAVWGDQLKGDVTVSIVDLGGRLMFSGVYTDTQAMLPVNNLPAGQYMLVVQDQTNILRTRWVKP